jgi:hypothetical protein
LPDDRWGVDLGRGRDEEHNRAGRQKYSINHFIPLSYELISPLNASTRSPCGKCKEIAENVEPAY